MADDNVPPVEDDEETPLFNGPLYDKLKFLAQVLLPAAGTLYVALAALWSLPNPEQVSGTVLAVDTFLGVLLHISTQQFKGIVARRTPDAYLSVEGHDPNTGFPHIKVNVTDKGYHKLDAGKPITKIAGTQPDPPVTR